MMVGHCHSHPSNIHGQGHQNNYHSHRHHHPHRLSRSGSESSSSREDGEQYSGGSGSSSSGNNNSHGGGGSGSGESGSTTASSSDYSLAISSSSDMGERSLHRHPSTASLLDSIERRTQRTYRYGIGLVCIGATLNWLGFAQGTNYIDPLRYLGVACVLTGSFCVCLAMCRWLSKPISVSGHHVTNLEEERQGGDVHVINVAVPMYVPNLHEEYRPTKPLDYEQIIAGEEAFPPPYDEAVKLRPSEFFGTPTPSRQGSIVSPSGVIMDAASAGEGGGNHIYISQFTQSSCQPSPSQHLNHHQNLLHHHHHPHQDLSRALLLDIQDTESLIGCGAAPTPTPTPTPCYLPQQQPHIHHHYLRRTSTPVVGEDPPPAYEPSPRPSISSCSSSAPLIPTSASRYDLPPSFSVRRIFGGGGGVVGGVVASTSSSPRDSPIRRSDSISNNSSGNVNGHLHDQVISEDVSLVVHQQQGYMPSLQLGNSDALTGNLNNNLQIHETLRRIFSSRKFHSVIFVCAELTCQ